MLLIDLKGCESLSQLNQRTDIMNTIKFFLTAIGCFLLAQTAIAAQPIPFDKYHWDFEAKSYQVETYKGGKATVIGWFVGQIMKQSKGKANPQIVRQILENLLAE
jgi:hypothetical protein